MLPSPRATPSWRRAHRPAVAALIAVALGIAAAPALASSGSVASFLPHNGCVDGTYTVPHGVTQLRVTAVGANGTAGQDVAFNVLGGALNPPYAGGTGGIGSELQATIPVTPGQTLYAGVANDGIPGGAGSGDNRGGGGGAATWITDTDPRQSDGSCKVSQAHVLVVAAGGGGGGGAGSRPQAHQGGAGGSEWGYAPGVNGSYGIFEGDEGGGGAAPSASGGGGGGYAGEAPGCASGGAGSAGSPLGGGAAGDGGVAAATDIHDCSEPSSCNVLKAVGSVCEHLGSDEFGAGGGGGGGGYFGGGGGGGSDDSGFGAGGGGAAGSSYARGATDLVVFRPNINPSIQIFAVTTPPAFTSADHTAFGVGGFNAFNISASGIEPPFISIVDGTLPVGVGLVDGFFSDGDPTGSASLQGTTTELGAFPITVQACNNNNEDCATQAFTLTVVGEPHFTSPDASAFVAGRPGSVTVTTTGFPKPAITQTGKPSWLTFTDNGDGTATLSGTPPAIGALNSYVLHLTAANGVGVNDTQTLTIPVIKTLSVSPSAVHLVPGANIPALAPYSRGTTQQFHATATFPDNTTGDVTSAVRWSSSNPFTASVSRGGLVGALSIGNTTITATTADNTHATGAVAVAVPISITVTPGSANLIPHQTQQFHATACYASPCSSNSYDITSNVVWSSLLNRLPITADGLAGPGIGGSYFVNADLFTSAPTGQVHGEASVSITHGNVVSVAISPSSRTATSQSDTSFAATVTYQDGSQDGTVDAGQTMTWTEEDVSGTGVAAIINTSPDITGHVRAQSAGTARIRATYRNPDGTTVSGTATLNVINIPDSIFVTDTDTSGTSFRHGTTRQYQAFAHYLSGPDVDVTDSVDWSSSDPTVVSIAQSGGLATSVTTQDGATARITATLHYPDALGNDQTVSGFRDVTTTLLPPTTLTVTPLTVATLHPGDTQQFTATGTYPDGSTVDLSSRVSWQPINTAVAHLSGSGKLTVNSGTTHGSVVIEAFYGGQTSNDVTVTVTDPVDHVQVVRDNASFTDLIAAGDQTTSYHVNGYDANGNLLGDVTSASQLTITPDGSCSATTRTCTATLAGAHTITATDSDAAQPDSTNSLPLTVTHASSDHITLTGGSGAIMAGTSTAPYQVTSYDAYDNSWDATSDSQLVVGGPFDPAALCTQATATPTCTANVAGAHAVDATYGSKFTSVPLRVDPSPTLASLTLSGGPSGPIAVGANTDPYAVTGTDPYGNSGVVRVFALLITPDGICDDEAHTCKAFAPGPHTVTAFFGDTSGGGGLASNTLSFDAVEVDHIQLSGDSSAGAGTSTAPYTVEGFDADGHDLGDVTSGTTLSIGPDGSCDDTAHTCSANAIDSGGSHHTVTATYSTGSHPTDSLALRVDTGLLDHIQLNGGSSSLTAGGRTAAYQVEGFDAGGNDLGDVTSETTLSIGPDGSCDDTTHSCTATVADTAGHHTVTATDASATHPTATAPVTVDPAALDHVVLNGGSASIIAFHNSAAYSVEGFDAYDNDIGDVTGASTLSVTPDGSCDNALHRCTAPSADTGGSHHTVTATDSDAAHQTDSLALLVKPNSPPTAPGVPDIQVGELIFNKGEFTLDWTGSTDANGDPVTYTIQRSADGSTWEDDVSGLTATSYTFGGANPPEQDGTWVYRIVASDGFSTTPGPPQANLPIMSDRTAPTTTDNVPSGWTNNPNATRVDLTADDHGGVGGVTTYYEVGVNPPDPTTSSHTGSEQIAIGNGEKIKYFSVDMLGNRESVETSNTLQFDGTPPQSFAQVCSDSCWTNDGTVTLSANDNSDGSGVAAIYYETGVNPTDPTTSSPAYDPTNKPVLANGESIKLFAVDNAGNAEIVHEYGPENVDKLAPSTSDNVPSTWQKTAPAVTLTATDSGGSGLDRTYYVLGANPDPSVFWANAHVYDPSNPPHLSNGQKIQYASVDNAGNEEAVKTSAAAMVDVAPPSTAPSAQVNSTGTGYTLTLTPTDAQSGVAFTKYQVFTGTTPPLPSAGTWSTYDSAHKPAFGDGQRVAFYSVDNVGNQEPVRATRTGQAINFGPLTDGHYGDADFAVSATADSGLTVSFAASGDCTMADATHVHITGAGSCTVTASQAGDVVAPPGVSYLPAPDVPQTFTILKGTATLTIDSASLTQLADGSPKPVTVSTSPVGLGTVTVTYDGSTSAPSAPGNYAVDASLDNPNYAAADATGTLVIGGGTQTISFGPLTDRTFGDANFAVSATASSGLTVTFTASGSCSMADATHVHLTGAGSCAITASQAGNSNWNAATDVKQTFQIAKAATNTSVSMSAYSPNPTPQFSDTVKVQATVTAPTGDGVFGGTVAFQVNGKPSPALTRSVSNTQPTASADIALVDSVIPNGAGSYSVTATFTPASGSNYLGSSDSKSQAVKHEGENADGTTDGSTRLDYSGDQSVNVGVAPNLAATLSQSLAPESTDAAFVDYSRQTVNVVFKIFPATCGTTCSSTPTWQSAPLRLANRSDWATTGVGSASVVGPKTLPDGAYIVNTSLVANGYIVAEASVAPLAVQSSTGTFITGSGYLAKDSTSNAASPRGSFAFDIKAVNKSLQGSSVYQYRMRMDVSASSATRIVPCTTLSISCRDVDVIMTSSKLTSLNGGTSSAYPMMGYATGQMNVQFIDAANSATHYSQFEFSGGSFRLDVTDASSGGSIDKYGFTAYRKDGSVFHQAYVPASGAIAQTGTAATANEATISGGNVTVHPH